jgi:hypothetical protein
MAVLAGDPLFEDIDCFATEIEKQPAMRARKTTEMMDGRSETLQLRTLARDLSVAVAPSSSHGCV